MSIAGSCEEAFCLVLSNSRASQQLVLWFTNLQVCDMTGTVETVDRANPSTLRGTND